MLLGTKRDFPWDTSSFVRRESLHGIRYSHSMVAGGLLLMS